MSCFGTNFVVTVRKLLHRQIRQHVPTSEVDPTLFKTTLGQKFGPQGYSLDADLEKCRPKLFEEVYEKREEGKRQKGKRWNGKRVERGRKGKSSAAFFTEHD
ncbi:hypothetical protein MCOR27_000979 [Pyricularia oryzae]|uniref:Uncharacterized protein n=5 Tax=Pyricularia TaxID=48558 RepID=A0ABQ8P091_PYRGI|nr:uncharacterized protein MGG_17762 [Pyricularia oryzae 70-15]ELQ44309.1 hypothetical protein OOU_Y34scaffold00092g2 [Pyricularia oryzae Y34]KAH8846236.1 hypothetical protein MCOR01_003439 [Pyricularia oryzae]KAI6304452.1 hypothetical protein MCOR33_000546 [Pyricularia grisea]EHA47753.1 hypothetical protein MGG_17762 [Pyricularia oryzae 70-15]KAI6258169.1 hypothetical protein MCOR19_005418 [Pyricularia oryzae]